MVGHMAPWERLLAIAGGLCLIIPGAVTDIVGVALVVVVFIKQKSSYKKIAA